MRKRRILLTSSALAIVLATAAAPAAAEPKLGVGGYMEQWFGYGASSVDERDGFDQQTDAQINFEGEAQLDNGLVVGAVVVLEAQTDADQIDSQYAYLEASFGRFEIGGNYGAPYLLSTFVPTVGAELDSGDAANWIAGLDANLINTAANFAVEEEFAHKITYLTPRVIGFQAGVTYASELSEDDNNGPRENNGVRDNAFGFGLNYERLYEDVTFGASAAYMNYGDDGAAAGPSPENISFGLSLGFSGFSVAATYNDLTNSVAGDIETYGVGVAYETGDLGLSFGYVRGEEDNAGRDSDAFELGGSYTLGPGVAAKGSLYYVDQDTPGGGGAEGAAAVGGITLQF